MSESQGNSGDETVPKRRDKGLMARALDERWDIPDRLRGPLIRRLGEIVQDPNAAPREVLAAASALMAASKINLANIATSINAEKHEELEQRMTDIERQLEARNGPAFPDKDGIYR